MHSTNGVRRLLARMRPYAALTAVAAAGLALFATSSATAASLVTNSDIAPGAVSKSKIRSDAVNADELCDRADPCGPGVQWYNIAPGAVGTGILADGGVHMDDLGSDVTSQLGKGEKGDPGEPGKDGVSGYEIVGRTADAQDVDTTTPVEVTSLCNSHGEVAIAGGAKVSGSARVVASYPGHIRQVSRADSDDPAGRWAADGWTVQVVGTGHVQPYIVCALMN